MDYLWNAFYFIIALGILVTIHEYGHFWVARKLGVKVLTFSVGFGKAIWQRRGKDGVNYVIAAIPLGGYVKMLDEREGEVSEQDKQFEFNRKSPWARVAIVLAGPVANFLLAIVLYWWMFIMGIDDFSTQLGKIEPNSIAGKAGLVAGDVITKVDGDEVVLLQDVVKAVARRLGEKTEIELEVTDRSNVPKKVILSLENWQVDSSQPRILNSLGIRHALQDIVVAPILNVVNKNSPADQAGLKPGDVIKEYDGRAVASWQELVSNIEPDAGKAVKLLIERNGELSEISVVIGSHERDGKQVGLLGVMPKPADYSEHYRIREGGVWESFELALAETGKMISLSAQLFKKLIIGDISPKSLSGPFSIAKGAGGSAEAGLVHFISFVAMISVNLGFINLLPIPVLDGGRLLFYSIEILKGKPLSEKVQEIGMQIGMLMVFALMAIAIFNDLRLY
ncbi:RIP metalloprotease RseP [Aliikangiella coralliicola]|uniref:Zinc metalloprotease n=1 Tax=Aliikangiella coralliicola TaxID=2592383 RepID=A0A545UAZ6_9GAMM|nr:RIP metalloprotease RseP [Aliikangiella coralliicola]TQV86638.1 RIP metalloprotease RseP [Aliikangiella coralliicola]